jgi:hypothetical protein
LYQHSIKRNSNFQQKKNLENDVEVFFIWQDAYKKGSVFDKPEFDLLSQQVDVLGGFQDSMRFGKHPRGKRWAFNKHGVYDSHIPECFTFVHFSTKTASEI